MIDTLFYFVDTELEYRRLMQGPDGKPGISPTTIVFVGDSREIYVNGKGYGKTSTNGLLASSEFDSWKGHLNERIDNAINNATAANDEAKRKAEEDLAAAMETIEAALDSTADDINTDILAVRQQIQEAKQQLQDNIDSANQNADEIQSELTEFQGTIRNELETSVRDAITNADGRTIWTELNTTNSGLTAVTNRVDKSLDSNGDLKNTSVLQSIIDSGVKNNTAITDIQNKWAVMDENQNLLQWVAAGFRSEANKEGGLARMFATAQDDTQNAISNMKTQIEKDVNDNYVASADLEASVIGIVEDELQVDSLAAIAMKSDVNSATTTLTNRLNTADQDRENIHTSLSQIQSTAQEGLARASLLTNVDENGTYFVNESSLDGAVNSMLAKSGSKSASLIHQMAQADIAAADISSQIGEATSSLATKVEVNEVVNNLTGEIEQRKTAVAGLQAQISGEDGLTNTIAGVNARVTDNEAQLTSIAQWQQGTDSWKAGVVQSADLDGAVAGLIADGTKESGKKTRAAVVATVNDDTSAIKINADHVFIDGAKTTTIGSHYDELYSDLNTALETSKSEINTRANAIESSLSALSTWKNDKGYVADAGLVTETNADHALATVIAKTGEARGQIAAMVEDGVSSITLSADKVHITGNQNVNIQSYFDGQIDDIESDINSLEGTVANQATSIASINTKADQNKSNIDVITTWKNNTESWKSGVQTTAGLGGAVASLFAEDATNDAKANVTAMVNGELSTLKLSADKVYIEGQQGVNIKSYFDTGLNNAKDSLNTSIASVDTKAEANKSSIQSLTAWKNDTESWKSGVQTTAGLGGAVASLFAENANTDAKANVTAMVNGATSTLTLSADKIYLDADRTLANTIEATQGHIGGMNIANNSLSSSNGNFSVNSTGKLVAKDAEIEGKIKATSIELGNNKISTTNISGLSNVATSGKYADLGGKPSIPSNISDLNDDITILKASDVSVSDSTSANGVTTRTITVGDKTYTSITAGDFILSNIGYGNKNGTYAQISSNGLLEARNAIIYGTIYATAGQIGGINIENNGIESDNGNFSVTSDGKLTATDAVIKGAITATSLTLSGTTIPATNVTGLSSIAKTGKWSDISDKPTFSAVATSGSYSDLSGKPTIPTVPSNIITADNVSISDATSEDGITTRTITVGNKQYTSIVSGDFVKTNIGLGTDNDKYVRIDSDGLLTAKNAVVYGTIYATGGQIGGIGVKDNSIESDNGNFSVTSAGKLTAKNAEIKGSITATDGTIGGFSIGNTNIHSGITAMNDNSHNGVYVGTDGIKLGSNDLFSVTNQGILTAKNANITGTINASTLNLGSTVTMPKADGTTETVSVDNLRNDKLPTVAQTGKFEDLADYATAVPSIAKTGKYSDLKDYATAVPSIAKTGKLAEASDYSSLPAIAKIGGGKLSDLSGYSSFPTYLKELRVPTKSEVGVTKLSDLTNDINVVKASDVTISSETTADGLTTQTITVGGKSYTSIVGGDFVRTNIGLGDTNDTYVEISNDGLLTAKNAVIYGTVYATAGQIGGIDISNNGIASSNGNFSLTSAGQLTATGAAISGTITATDGTIGGYTIDSDKLYVTADKSGFANLLGFNHASLTIEKNTSYEELTGDPYATHSIQFGQFIADPQAYFPSIQAIQKSDYKLDDGATKSDVTDKHIVQLSPIGFRTAYDCVKTTSLIHGSGSSTTTKEFTETNRIDATGSGMLGNGGIEWDNDGQFTVSDGFAKSVFDSMQDGFSKTTSTGSGSSKVTTKNTVTPTYESIKLQKDVTTASNGTTTTNAMEITPDAIKVTKNGTTSIGITQSFRIKATGTYQGATSNYDLTLTFTNGILTGYSTNGFPGSTI